MNVNGKLTPQPSAMGSTAQCVLYAARANKSEGKSRVHLMNKNPPPVHKLSNPGATTWELCLDNDNNMQIKNALQNIVNLNSACPLKECQPIAMHAPNAFYPR